MGEGAPLQPVGRRLRRPWSSTQVKVDVAERKKCREEGRCHEKARGARLLLATCHIERRCKPFRSTRNDRKRHQSDRGAERCLRWPVGGNRPRGEPCGGTDGVEKREHRLAAMPPISPPASKRGTFGARTRGSESKRVSDEARVEPAANVGYWLSARCAARKAFPLPFSPGRWHAWCRRALARNQRLLRPLASQCRPHRRRLDHAPAKPETCRHRLDHGLETCRRSPS